MPHSVINDVYSDAITAPSDLRSGSTIINIVGNIGVCNTSELTSPVRKVSTIGPTNLQESRIQISSFSSLVASKDRDFRGYTLKLFQERYSLDVWKFFFSR